VHPNPLVGAVVLQDGRVVGEGWHAEFGAAHAEVAALRAAGPAASGGTMVVTLEPCRHHGQQPPCTEAILAAGIRRVVFGLADPNPGAGGGAALLAQRGLEVAEVRHAAAAEQNAAFLHRFGGASRPFVALKLATSVDGRVADYTGRARWISGPIARVGPLASRRFRCDRWAAGRPAPTTRPHGPRRVVPRVPPRRVVFDRRADLAELTAARHRPAGTGDGSGDRGA
jgi:diaminohydroxyphosphoribosylaminopyrimidine deaminase/5-amino-6-(5-phosphoribosylamino)uracil reductase